MGIVEYFRPLWKELRALNRLAIISVVCNTLDASFTLVDIIMLGWTGRGHLSAAVIAFAFYNVAWLFAEGVLTAQDTLLARSFALNDIVTARYWTYIALLAVTLLNVTSTVFFGFAPLILSRAFSIRSQTAVKAAEFLLLLIPAFWLHGLYRVVHKFLLGQNLQLSAAASAAVGVLVNIVGNTFFMQLLGLNLIGCGIATIVGRAGMLAAVLIFLHRRMDLRIAGREITDLLLEARQQIVYCGSADSSSSRGGYNRVAPDEFTLPNDSSASSTVANEIELTKISTAGVSNDNADDVLSSAAATESVEVDEDEKVTEQQRLLISSNVSSRASASGRSDGGGGVKRSVVANLLRFLVLGVPGGLLLGLDSWIYELLTVMVAQMGSIAVDAHQILVVIISFIYISIPFAISVAATVRITYLLSAKKFKQARTTAILTLLQCIVLSGVASLVLYLLRGYIGYAFSGDTNIAYRIKELMLYASCFLLAYGVAGGAQGVLRATSHQWDIFTYTFLALWLVALLLGAFLAFVVRPTYELRGLWVGLVVGMSLLAATLLLQVLCLDWQKESRKMIYRNRRASDFYYNRNGTMMSSLATGAAANGGGGRRRQHLDRGGIEPGEEDSSGSSSSGSNHVDTDVVLGGASVEDGIELTRIGALKAAGSNSNGGEVDSFTVNPLVLNGLEVGIPAVGSRAVGGLPISFWRSAEEELHELEHVEFGSVSSKRSAK